MTGRSRYWLSHAIIAAAFVTLTAWSWRKWPDVLVDFGQQLYIPWRLAGGERLYRDIALLHGPLSQHLNAALFRIFGSSFSVLIVANLAVLGAITAVVYCVFRRAADRLTATTACLLLLCLFGFSQYLPTGNYNYVAPYTHEATHGILLTTGMVLLLSRYLAARQRSACLVAGLCLGLALLTKLDIAAAAIAVAGAAFAAAWLTRREGMWPDLGFFGLAAAAPLLVFFMYFLSYLPAEAALAAVLSAFTMVPGEVANNPFYRSVLGTDDVEGNVLRMFAMFAVIASGVIGAAAVDIAVATRLRRPPWLGIALGAALLLAIVLSLNIVPWGALPRALPLTTGGALMAFGWLFLRSHREPAQRSAFAPVLLWSVLALALLSKMALNARIPHYGFYLAMPAVLLLSLCLVWGIPQALRSWFGGGRVFRSLALAVLATVTVFHLGLSSYVYELKTLSVGRGGDTILTYAPEVNPVGSVLNEALQWIALNTPTDATLAPLPEGIMLNYLARRPTTLPVINFMMTEKIVFGEDVIIGGLESDPPDYVAIVEKDTSEFGVGPFGVDPDYGARIMDQVNRTYEPVALFGDEPFSGNVFGIRILEHR